MNLSAPTNIVFIISVVIAILGLLAALGVIPGLAAYGAWIILLGYVILAAGCLLKDF